MCGINGIFYFQNNAKNLKKSIVAMNKKIAHRGQDNDGIFIDNNIALGHRRLSIIDLSNLGNQPMVSKNKRFYIIYNGEIYNFLSIKNELKEFEFKTNTDTEVVLNAYQKWGKDCLQKFNGMFAFAIWDNLKKEIFIARDRLGIKPLYFYRDEEKIIFSSEIRAILASNLIENKLNTNALSDYLRYQTVHAPRTFVKNISILEPANFIYASAKTFFSKNYWNILKNYHRQINVNEQVVKKKVFDLLEKSVERRMLADVPFGAFLSGGIDSSIIVGLMSKVAKHQVNTFSVSFAEKEFSEAKYAEIIAKKFKTNHTEIQLKVDDFLHLLPNALDAMDFPSGDGANSYVVSKKTKEAGISMALSGLGGDEIFAGYPVFKQILKLNKHKNLKKTPYFIKKTFAEILKKLRPSVASEKIAEILLLNNWDLENIYPISRKILTDNEILKLLNTKKIEPNFVQNFLLKQKFLKNLPILSQISFAEINTYLQNTLLRDTDQMSMANTLEVRVPFLDHELIEYVFGVSDKLKYPTTPKKLLTESVGNLIPNEIINRQKMGFVFPFQKWLKNDLKDFAHQKISSLSQNAIFNEENMMSLWTRFLKNDKRVSWSRIWLLIVLQNWIEKNNIKS